MCGKEELNTKLWLENDLGTDQLGDFQYTSNLSSLEYSTFYLMKETLLTFINCVSWLMCSPTGCALH